MMGVKRLFRVDHDTLALSPGRSIVAIPSCECLVQLQPWKRYIISVRAVNIGGPSERSEPIDVSTAGSAEFSRNSVPAG